MAAPATPPRRPAKRNTGSVLSPLAISHPQARTQDEALTTPLTASSPIVPNPTAMRHRDPAIDRALQLSSFESNYTVEEFIGTLSEKLIGESKAAPGPFDPKPFLQTFSPALDSLLALRSQVAERTKKMETDVRRAEREYGRRLRELDGGFETIGSSFSNLESKITDVGRTAVRIGEQLESLHQTRSTAQSTSLLLSYYLSLAHQTSMTPDPNNPSASSTPLEALFATRTSREGRARLAIILRRLMGVAKDVADNAAVALTEAEAAYAKEGTGKGTGTEGGGGAQLTGGKLVVRRRTEKEKAERVRDEVERYCERFEKEVLRLFDRSYRKGDPRMMAHCAKTLQDFNGGASCVQIYVNQHDFFISKDRILEEAEKLGSAVEGENAPAPTDIWKTIGDPDAPAPTSEPGLAALFKDVRNTVNQEAQIVKAVFPDPAAVLQVFLQRIFAQVIQQQLESLVARATAISTLAVLRILNLAHALTSTLIDDLKAYDLTSTEGSGSSKTGTSSPGSFVTMLDHAMEEMFVPWLEGSRFLESENKNLVELYAGLLSRFTRYHETILKAKPNTLLDKVVGQLSASGTAAASSSTAQSAAAAISKYANLFTSGGNNSTKSPHITSPTVSQKPNPILHGHGHGHLQNGRGAGADGTRSGAMTPVARPGGALHRADSVKGESINKGLEDKVWATDGVLTIEVAERMLKWHAEAVGRVVELSSTSEIGKNALTLSKTLAEAIGRLFIETALDSAIAKFEGHDSKLEPDLQPLSVLKPADQICHLWQRYTSTAVFPLTGTTPATRKEMGSLVSLYVGRMEGKINTVIQKAIDAIINWLTYLLTKQKKYDYRPKNDELSFARNNTEPCTLCCEFLSTVKSSTYEGLSGKNAEVFLTEIGVAFHSLLLDHYKKFPVNPTGGLMLTKDLASYQDVIATFALPPLNDRFDMLRQLGNTFIVQPNVLKSYMTESHLGRVDARYLKPYLAQRADYSTFSKSLQLDDAPDDRQGQGQGQVHDKDKGKGNSRLSVMTGVAGAGMGKLKDMLKEFDNLSMEQSSQVAQRDRAVADQRKRINQGPTHAPMYFAVGHM